MADTPYTVTAANVKPSSGSNSKDRTGIAGASITAGMPVYLDSSDSDKVKPARANADLTSRAVGIALCSASTGQPVTYATQDDALIHGLTSVPIGTPLFVGKDAAGTIVPPTDLVTGYYTTFLGTAITSTAMKLKCGDAMQSRVSHA